MFHQFLLIIVSSAITRLVSFPPNFLFFLSPAVLKHHIISQGIRSDLIFLSRPRPNKVVTCEGERPTFCLVSFTPALSLHLHLLPCLFSRFVSSYIVSGWHNCVQSWWCEFLEMWGDWKNSEKRKGTEEYLFFYFYFCLSLKFGSFKQLSFWMRLTYVL